MATLITVFIVGVLVWMFLKVAKDAVMGKGGGGGGPDIDDGSW